MTARVGSTPGRRAIGITREDEIVVPGSLPGRARRDPVAEVANVADGVVVVLGAPRPGGGESSQLAVDDQLESGSARSSVHPINYLDCLVIT